MHRRSPAVISTYTHLCKTCPYHSIVYLWQLITMHCIFHLMRCVWKCAETHLISCKHKSSSFCVSYLCPSYLLLISTLLRHQILRHIICHLVVINTKLCSFFAVCVGFFRSKTIPLESVIISTYLHHHTKLRHISKLFYHIISHMNNYRSISVHIICNLTAACRCSRHSVLENNSHIVFLLLIAYRGTVKHSCCLMCDIHTCDFPLSVFLRHTVSVIIIYRCSPEIWHRDFLYHFPSTIFV